MAEEPTIGEGTAEADLPDLAQEFERIDEEKARLRLLADQLGLRPPGASAAAAARPAPHEEAGPVPPPPQAAPAAAVSGAGAGPTPTRERRPGAGDEAAERRRPTPRPSLPREAAAGVGPRHPAPPPHSTAPPRRSPRLLEALTGFVPVALYEEIKRERDELFFRLTKLEMERSQLERVRRTLDTMEAEIRRLEEELQRRRGAEAPAVAEPLRLCYRRWLHLRRRRSVLFSDYLACRRTERGEP